MADVLTREQRSRCMAAIRGKNTKPELTVRRLVFALGYRFRLHRATFRASRPCIPEPQKSYLRSRMFLACARLPLRASCPEK